MPLAPITEQQFRTRRKDRKMVWVDAAAFLAGLIMLVAGVGGVVMVEEDPEPFEWGYSFFEGKVTAKNCVGYTGLREGCTSVIQGKDAEEGETIKTTFDPVDQANVTAISFTLRWVDDFPITTGTPQECLSHCGKRYDYTNESTDILRVKIIPPAGVEPRTEMLANDVDTKIGEVTIEYEFLPIPEPGRVRAFTMEEARAQVVPMFIQPQHAALGAWSAEVTVVRAGDQNGTMPTTACPPEADPVTGALPPDVTDNCSLHQHQDTVEGAGGEVRPPNDYYASSYDDEGNKWMLDMVIRSYDVNLAVG